MTAFDEAVGSVRAGQGAAEVGVGEGMANRFEPHRQHPLTAQQELVGQLGAEGAGQRQARHGQPGRPTEGGAEGRHVRLVAERRPCRLASDDDRIGSSG